MLPDGGLDVFLSAVLILTVGIATFAIRMSYEKYCVRTRKPFRSWLGKDR